MTFSYSKRLANHADLTVSDTPQLRRCLINPQFSILCGCQIFGRCCCMADLRQICQQITISILHIESMRLIAITRNVPEPHAGSSSRLSGSPTYSSSFSTCSANQSGV